MKDIKTYINESLFETNTWTYLCMGYRDGVSFFIDGNWNPHDISVEIENKFIIVNSNKDLNTNQSPMANAWKKKYNEAAPKWFDIILYSYGDNQQAKHIKEIGKAIDSEKITLEDFLTKLKEFNGAPENKVDFIYNKLFTK